MDTIFVNPITGMMLSVTYGATLVAIPGRPIIEYTPEEMEYVTLATPKPNPRVTYAGQAAGHPRR